VSYLKRHFIWSLAFLVLWLGLFFGTDIKLTWPQAFLVIVSFHCYGASQRNHARYQMERGTAFPKDAAVIVIDKQGAHVHKPGDMLLELQSWSASRRTNGPSEVDIRLATRDVSRIRSSKAGKP
jgi:hypothetical protein